MKKLGVVLASALAAGLFFGCSNDSDDNNMGLLLAVANGGSSSITANLPENVGANELAGKSFKNELGYETISFDNNTVTFTKTENYPENQENGTRAYKTNIITKRYSYNAETKNLYYNNNNLYFDGKIIYSNDANEKLERPVMTFSTEEEYSAKLKDFYKKLNKLTGNESTDEELNERIESELKYFRMTVHTISSLCNLPPAYTAYTDKKYETPLTPAQVSLYNKYMTKEKNAKERTIECHAYKLEGGNLKLANSGNLPAGIKFGGIYNGTYNFSADIKNNGISIGTININVFEIIDPNNSLGAKDFTPSIKISNGPSFKVTSASDDSVTGIWKVSDLISEKITLKLENETTTEKTTVTIKMPIGNGDYTPLGTFEIPYNNIPDYYTTYTKCE